MRKAFDANVPKVKPRLRPMGVAEEILEPGAVAEAEPAPAVPAARAAVPGDVPALEPSRREAGRAAHRAGTAPVARAPAAREIAPSHPSPAAPAPAAASPVPAAPPSPAPAAASPAAQDLAGRRERLDKIKRKVAEAARRGAPTPAAARPPARAAESALSLVHDMEGELARSRDMEEALRADLAQARADLARAAGEVRGTGERLGLLESELEEKRGVLAEMLGEMSALEEERDEAVRRAQALAALDEERQRLTDDLSRRADELERALGGSRAEVERLGAELDERTAEGARLRGGLAEVVRERDALSRELDEVRGERDELLEARRALEKVHEALSQARQRLG